MSDGMGSLACRVFGLLFDLDNVDRDDRDRALGVPTARRRRLCSLGGMAVFYSVYTQSSFNMMANISSNWSNRLLILL